MWQSPSWIFENAPGWNFNHVPLKMKTNRTWNNISDKNSFTPFPPKWRFHLTTEVIRHAAGKLILQVLTLPLWPPRFLFCFVLFRSSMFVSFVLFFIGGHTESPWGRFQWIIWRLPAFSLMGLDWYPTNVTAGCIPQRSVGTSQYLAYLTERWVHHLNQKFEVLIICLSKLWCERLRNIISVNIIHINMGCVVNIKCIPAQVNWRLLVPYEITTTLAEYR